MARIAHKSMITKWRKRHFIVNRNYTISTSILLVLARFGMSKLLFLSCFVGIAFFAPFPVNCVFSTFQPFSRCIRLQTLLFQPTRWNFNSYRNEQLTHSPHFEIHLYELSLQFVELISFAHTNWTCICSSNMYTMSFQKYKRNLKIG